MFKKIMMPALAGLVLVPTLASSATVAELEERLLKLEDQSMVSAEGIYDINTRVENQMVISGYTDVEFISDSRAGTPDGFRLHHMSLFFEKNMGDKWRFFSEVEYEDAPKFEGTTNNVIKDADGKIFLEAVNMTYLWRQEANLRFGRMFTPAGIWSVDHYPTFVPTQERPQHIRAIFPQNVDGAQVFGTLGMGSSFLNYDAYVGNGRSDNAGKSDDNSTKAIGAKLSFLFPLLNHFELGSSYYTDAQDSKEGGEELTATGFHGKMKAGQATLQFEVANGEWETTEREGAYVQLMYDWDKYTFGVRADTYDEDSGNSASKSEITMNSVFANYHVNKDVTLKIEFHAVDNEDPVDEDYEKTIISVVGYLGN
ncbi:MAG: porin [Gammaproteobacteria bacterium]|nr:porin [Gammaproteobacteria bacterium]